MIIAQHHSKPQWFHHHCYHILLPLWVWPLCPLWDSICRFKPRWVQSTQESVAQLSVWISKAVWSSCTGTWCLRGTSITTMTAWTTFKMILVQYIQYISKRWRYAHNCLTVFHLIMTSGRLLSMACLYRLCHHNLTYSINVMPDASTLNLRTQILNM